MRDRTADPLLAKQVLSQLSYTPISFQCAIHNAQFAIELRFTLIKNNDFKSSEI